MSWIVAALYPQRSGVAIALVFKLGIANQARILRSVIESVIESAVRSDHAFVMS
jgi:hypothetical protein